ncbi:hypothetical protein BDZ97DRAFT_1912579 [Flammula alnicola]|nr:hypothetical protein BDZ97DRAFT_1912579 [Flammula alnicola]
MFPKGPRFEPLKVSDVPAPNAYNIPQDSILDSYKRGAFLEKTDRFSKDKQPILPAPTSKPSSSTANPQRPPQNQSATERYNLLQKKVDDLEKVHLEGKKARQAEVERLKQDISASQKFATEQAERFEKQKKQNALLDARFQELKKVNTSDQSEIKDLRHKLRLLELERDKMSSKQPEIVELKKSLSTLEAKRKDEIKERDRRIAELEKQLQTEQKKRESFEGKVKDSKRALEEEVQTLQTTTKEMAARVQKAQAESQAAKEKLRQIEYDVEHREDELVEQLEQHRCLLTSVVQQYGALASQSVLSTVHRRLQLDNAALQLRQLRLERKLANSEGQVVELTHLFRQVKEDNKHLNLMLQGALEEISFFANLEPSSSLETYPHADGSQMILQDISDGLRNQHMELAKVDANTNELISTFYHLKSHELCLASSVFAKECADAQTLAEHRASDLSSALASHEAIATRLESIQKERAASEEKLASATTEADNLRASTAILEAQLADMQQELDDSVGRHANAVKKDKETIQRLTSTVQKTRVAEDALRAEIEQLTTELANARISRKREAERISKFNAEILGHNNPAQRIMYVDRIRRELAEAKHKIVLLTREQENVAAQNDELQHELDMYTSVRVPLDSKPRTNITRIGRAPLVNLAHSLNSGAQSTHAGNGKASFLPIKPVIEVNDTDMTIDGFI